MTRPCSSVTPAFLTGEAEFRQKASAPIAESPAGPLLPLAQRQQECFTLIVKVLRGLPALRGNGVCANATFSALHAHGPRYPGPLSASVTAPLPARLQHVRIRFHAAPSYQHEGLNRDEWIARRRRIAFSPQHQLMQKHRRDPGRAGRRAKKSNGYST